MGDLVVGETVTATGIPTGTTIVSIDSSSGTLRLWSEAAVSGAESLSVQPSPAQVAAASQAYASNLYQSDIAFFNSTYGSNWMSMYPFQKDFQYQATSQQAAALTPAGWSTNQLDDAVPLVALEPADGTPVGLTSPNISGANVTLTASGNIGLTGSTTTQFITLAELNGSFTAAQAAALADATAPGDVVGVGVTGKSTRDFPIGQTPDGVTPTGIQVTPTTQLLVDVAGTLAASSGGPSLFRTRPRT